MHPTVGRLIGITVCGVIGALVAWGLIAWIALDGVPGALMATGVGVVVATAAFVGWTTLGRIIGRDR